MSDGVVVSARVGIDGVTSLGVEAHVRRSFPEFIMEDFLAPENR
jgi:hypothetical protein